MSSRQLRKLQKQRELDQAQATAAQGSDESDTGPVPVAAKPRVSLFAALGGDEDEEDEEQEEADEAQKEPSPAEDDVSASFPASSGKSKKKKKKKKAKAKAAPQDVLEESEDEIDKAIKELNINAGPKLDEPADTNTGIHASRRIHELLAIDPYKLKAVNEMRNLFGRDVIESAETEDGAQPHRGPLQQHVDLETYLRTRPGAPKLPEISLRRNVFIQGREQWPRANTGGLTMQEVGTSPHGLCTEYAFVHDKEYDVTQCSFYSRVQSGNLPSMVNLLQEHPYHISALLQCSSIARQDQNMAFAAELCERALFTFGRVTTSAFRKNIEQGRARLSFSRPENRQFWLAGYYYIKSLVRKGTYRTALEWAKLLYSFDTSDPYAMRHFIHLLAIRAHQPQWLLDFMNEVEKTTVSTDTVYLRQTQVLAKLQLGDTEGARKDLEAGLKRVPWLYCALFQELGLDAPPSIWGISANSNARSFWVQLYIHQAKGIWNNTQAAELLQSVAKSLGKVDTSVLPADDAPADLGATRLAYLEGQTSLLAVAPQELLVREPNYEFDPIPPLKEDNIFNSLGVQMPWLENGTGEDMPSVVPHMQNLMARLREVYGNRIQNPLAALEGGAGAGAGADDDVDLANEPDWTNPVATTSELSEGMEQELAILMLEEYEAVMEAHPRILEDPEERVRAGYSPGMFEQLLQNLGIPDGVGEGGRGGEQAGGPEGMHRAERHGGVDQGGQRHESGGMPGAWPEEEEEGPRGRR